MKFIKHSARLALLLATSALICGADAPDEPKLVQDIKRSYGSLERDLRTLDRSQFDLQAVIEQVGRSPEKLTAWVASQTRLLPYRGQLRGPTGVLLDRGGNSLDRATLLANLIQNCGYNVRLAQARLTADQANALRAQLSATPLTPVAPAPPPAVAAVHDRVRRHTDHLVEALGQVSFDGLAQQQADALADHWWVQWQKGTEWIDVDICNVGAIAARTVDLTPTGDPLLETEDRQDVELRVIVEAFRDGVLTTHTVLKQSFRPYQTIGRSINLAHYVGKPVPETDFSTDADARARLKKALVAQVSYMPALFVDERCITNASFTTSGLINEHPQLDETGALSNAATSALSDALGGGAEEDTTHNVLTAEWVEYEIRVPGQKPTVVRREIFDLIGPAARAAGVKQTPQFTDAQKLSRSLRMLSSTQILFQPCELAPSFVLYALARQEMKHKPIWMSIGQTGTDIGKKLDEARAAMESQDLMTPTVAMIRAAAAPNFGGVFIDRTNVIQHTRWIAEGKDGQFSSYGGIDLSATSTASLAGDGKAAFRARVEQGIADTLAEQLALGSLAAKENTVVQFEAAGNNAGTVVRPGDTAALAALKLPADAAARAKADLAAGNTLVLASAQPDRWAWWRVAPDGQTVGVMDSGYNQALTEEQINEEIVAYNELMGTNMTRNGLRKATQQQLEQWAAKHPINPQGALRNLMGLQDDLAIHWRVLTEGLRGFGRI